MWKIRGILPSYAVAAAVLFQAQLIGNRSRDGALEKAWIVARVQHGGIGERELAKILFGDEALLNHLERFGYDIGKVGHVKVREVATCKSLEFLHAI